jgi:hypothetical protein
MGQKIIKQFETDTEGNVILKPVIGWTLTDVDAMNVLLQIRYEDGPEDIGTSGKAIQFVLTPTIRGGIDQTGQLDTSRQTSSWESSELKASIFSLTCMLDWYRIRL